MVSHIREKEEEKKRVEEAIKVLQTSLGEQDVRLNQLQSTTIQLANFYFVFQGVILTIVSNDSSKFSCSYNRIYLFFLSLLAALLNLAALVLIGWKYNESIKAKDRTLNEGNVLLEELVKLDKSSASASASAAASSSLTKPESPPTSSQEHRPSQQDSPKWVVNFDPEEKPRKVWFLASLIIFILFAILVLVACLFVPSCKHALKNDKCFRLCDGAKCMHICYDN